MSTHWSWRAPASHYKYIIVYNEITCRLLISLLSLSSLSRIVANYVQWRAVFSRITTLSRRFLYRYLDYARVRSERIYKIYVHVGSYFSF